MRLDAGSSASWPWRRADLVRAQFVKNKAQPCNEESDPAHCKVPQTPVIFVETANGEGDAGTRENQSNELPEQENDASLIGGAGLAISSVACHRDTDEVSTCWLVSERQNKLRQHAGQFDVRICWRLSEC